MDSDQNAAAQSTLESDGGSDRLMIFKGLLH